MTSASSDRPDGGRGGKAELELGLERNVEAPAAARAAVSALCQDHELGGSVSQTLVLLVSEVVSNAVLHSSGPAEAQITLAARLTEDSVRITVTDAGEGFVPGQRDPARLDGGYGLYLLEKAASRWGVDPTPPTSVWFEVLSGARAPGVRA